MTFLVKLIFCRLDKFDGSVFFLGAYIGGGSYIWDANWVIYFFWGGGGGGISGEAYIRGVVNGILRYLTSSGSRNVPDLEWTWYNFKKSWPKF